MLEPMLPSDIGCYWISQLSPCLTSVLDEELNVPINERAQPCLVKKRTFNILNPHCELR